MHFTIHLAESDADVLATYPVMKELRPHVEEASYLDRVQQLRNEGRYELVALQSAGEVVCVSGFRLCHNLGWNRYLYVDDLVTSDKHRSSGAGKAMFQWLVARAHDHGCDELRLDSATWRYRAHRFYLREYMDIAAFNFRLDLRSNGPRADRPSTGDEPHTDLD